MKPLFHPGMTPEELAEASRKYVRVVDFVFEKLQYLPEQHKADIRRVFMEEGLTDGQSD